MPPLIVIVGATATGKTGLSIELAERINGAQIVGADSRQVYRGMDIGTAKVTDADRLRVAHHGIDLVDPDVQFTAADYQRAAFDALAAIAADDGVALLVGGTGLYIRAVARGMPLTETGRDEVLRAQLEERLAGEGLASLARELVQRAPSVAAATDLANARRVVRALERVSVAGDRPPPAPRGYPARSVWIGLALDPVENARRIDERARAQFEAGLLDEARQLRDRFDAALPAFSATGYREAFDVLDGKISAEEGIARDAARTRQLARRQRTWFRAEPDINWLDATSATLVDDALAVARTHPAGGLGAEDEAARVDEARHHAPAAKGLRNSHDQLVVALDERQEEFVPVAGRAKEAVIARAVVVVAAEDRPAVEVDHSTVAEAEGHGADGGVGTDDRGPGEDRVERHAQRMHAGQVGQAARLAREVCPRARRCRRGALGHEV